VIKRQVNIAVPVLIKHLRGNTAEFRRTAHCWRNIS